MKRGWILLLALLFLFSGCAAQKPSVTLSASPLPTATPTPSPTATPAPTATPEDGLFLDYSGAQTIRASYSVGYPEARMAGWTRSQPGSPNALCTLSSGESQIEVTLEEMPDVQDLAGYKDYYTTMLGFAYEGLSTPEWEQSGDKYVCEILLPAEVETRLYLTLWEKDGLYAAATLRAHGATMEEHKALFTDVFLPGLTLTYDPEAMGN